MPATTEEKIRAQFPDLKFVKNPSVIENTMFLYPGFNLSTTTLNKGHIKSEGKRPFPADAIYQRDVTVTMRDGIKVYTDVFRPTDSTVEKVPALLVWSPYGKTGTGPQQYLTMGPFSCGVPLSATSGYEKFEGPDPAEWCQRGYAIVNIDSRGAGMSEGNTFWWGIQEAEDVYDTIDWIITQPWCDGSVAMVGNSWLAIAQINFASRLKHPAVKALAPMEALNDIYRDVVARGGAPHHVAFCRFIMGGFTGPGYTEDMPGMLENHPLFDEYWQSKYIDTSKIDVPLYLTASYSSGLHVAGSFNTFRTAKTPQKWLRVHPYQEWSDLYRPEVVNDLQTFFDHFCKAVDNGWETSTPPVRLSLLSFEGSPAKAVLERPENEYPLARQKLVTYFLDASARTMKPERPAAESHAAHDSHSLTASTDFELRFSRYTEIAGYAKAVVWMSCDAMDDMDVTVHLRKINAEGQMLEHLNYPCPIPAGEVANTNIAKTLGPEGFLRASHAVSRDDTRTTGNGQEVFYAHDRHEAVPRGTKVRLEITLWPMGMVFEKDEGLVLRISGREMIYPEFEMIAPTEPADDNQGEHVVYTGGLSDSHLILPIIG